MIVTAYEDAYGNPMESAVCSACGVEYEVDMGSGVLWEWSFYAFETTTLRGPDDWESLVANHKCEEIDQ